MGVTEGLLDGTVELLEYCLTQVDNSHLISLALELMMKNVVRSWIDGFPLSRNFTSFSGREFTRVNQNSFKEKHNTFFYFEDLLRPVVTAEVCLQS